MPIKSVKITAKYQITIPKPIREKLNIKVSDSLLVDVQDEMLILIPQGKKSAYLQGLHSEIWKGVDVQKYLDEERESWTNS